MRTDPVALLDAQAPPLVAFVRAGSPSEAETALATEPGLLAGAYDHLLDELIVVAAQAGADAARAALEQRRALLEALRDATTPELANQLGRIALAADRRADPADAASLHGSVEAWERFTSAPGLAAAPRPVRAHALNRLGIACSRCHAAGRGPEHQQAALRAFERAIAEDPETDYRVNALIVRLEQAEHSEHPPLDELVALAQNVLADAQPGHRAWASAAAQLAEAHALRYAKLGRSDDLAAAADAAARAAEHERDDDARERHRSTLERIRGWQRAVGAGGDAELAGGDGDHALERARAAVAAGTRADGDAHFALAGAAYARYRETGRLELLDEAIAASEACLRRTPPASDAYAGRVNDFGMLLRQRHQDRHGAGDLWKAVSALRLAVERTPKTHESWAGRAMNLGNALGQLHELTGAATVLDEAIGLLGEVRERSPVHAPERRQQLSALSRVLRLRFKATGDRGDLERSVALDAAALEGIPDAHPERALLLVNAANGLARIAPGRDERWARAVEMWRTGCRLGLEREPALALTAGLTWLELSLERGAATDATEGAALALDALDALVASQGARRDQEQWLSAAARLPALAARVLVGAGQPEAAVVAVERARARLLSLLLEREDELGRPTLGDLRELTSKAPLAYLIAGDDAMALLVRPAGVQVLPLPALTDAAVQDAVSRVYAGYFARGEDPGAWQNAFDEVTRWLWTAAMGPLLDALAGTERLDLLPGGLLALLPIHAAWEPGPSGERRYACDLVQLATQPNARLLMRPAPQAPPLPLVAVADPRPTREPPLTWAPAEAHIAAAAFPGGQVLVHEQATREEAARAAEQARVVHWACHGHADVQHPPAGGLVLADDEVLTLEQMQASRLRARLVVASACESAAVAPGLPDEVVSFAGAVLQAGAEAVLATSFAVDDLTALLVCARFYDAWRGDVTGPAALQAATAFVRDTTNAEKLEWLRERGAPPEIADMLAFADPDERSFEHPVHWAPFTWWGRHVVA